MWETADPSLLNIFDFDLDDDTPLDSHFESLGWETIDSIRNLGSTFIFLVFDLVVLISVLIMKKLNIG